NMKNEITALILAGGRGTRMDGADKGLLVLAGRPLVAHVQQNLLPQVSTLFISANRNVEQYQPYCERVIKDEMGEFWGPLAGVASALPFLKTEYLLVVPCDAPLLPGDLVMRLFDGLQAGQQLAVAFDGKRLQNTVMLMTATQVKTITAYLQGGGRKVQDWIQQAEYSEVDFSNEADAFINVNEEKDIKKVQDLLKYIKN
ncbi:MAG: molybdenum cofactor guanylyltransferase MobA, partial [Acidiferrobacterales bacterium]